MAPWPPGPVVEDELTALAREHTSEAEEPPKKDEQAVPSKGDVNQYPIIVDSDSSTENLVKDHKRQPETRPIDTSRKQTQPQVPCSFQPDTGLPTPPASDSETRGRASDDELGRNRPRVAAQSRSKSSIRKPDTTQARPVISRIQTDVTGEGQRVKASPRRPTSPFAYTREAGTFRVDSVRRKTSDKDQLVGSENGPVAAQHGILSSGPRADQDAVKPTKTLRFDPQATHSESEMSQPVGPRSHPHEQDRHTVHEQPYTSRERQHSTQYEQPALAKAENDLHQEPYSISDQSSRQTARSSPSASADESVREDRYKHTRTSDRHGHVVQRRLSHRSERPRLDPSPINSYNSSGSTRVSDDTSGRRSSHRSQESESLSAKTGERKRYSGEDYFSRSWQPPRHSPRSSRDETSLQNHPVSPPRTPRAESGHRWQYFQSPASSPPRSPSHSRGPSVDDLTRDSKAHASLLTQALSTAAVKASRTTGGISRSTANAFETTLACSASPIKTQSRSRASSPQRDRAQRSDTYIYTDQAMPQIKYPPVPQPRRPSTRDGLPNATVLPSPIVAPQRNASWTSYEPQQTNRPQYDTSQGASSATAKQPSLSRTASASTAANTAAQASKVAFQPCPRVEPSQGQRDWLTLQGLSSIDICPSCAQTIYLTRWQPLLQRSTEKPYDRWTSCSFSRPWVRVAFQQSLMKSKPDVNSLQGVIELPKATFPCSGSEPDVRGWWTLRDPETHRTVSDFFACSACIRSVHLLFHDLPDQFSPPGPLQSEQTCSFHREGSNFEAMVRILSDIDKQCRDRQKSSARYMQPFIDHVRRGTKTSKCAKDAFLTNRAWHFMNDLPEFTICDACYEDAVLPHRERISIARNISLLSRPVTTTSIRAPNQNLVGSKTVSNTPVSCQLYSDRTRSLFADVLNGRINYETFKSKVKERQEAQCRLTEMNLMLEDDQRRFGWSRQAELDRNRAYWKALE